ncbi:MAG: hypothetical protein IPH80_33960 [Myxococcales bacterium]|nr:hypothetical protein [Myxococcales bacterium]
MANYKLFNGVGAAVTAPVGFTADVDLIFDMGQPPHRASIDLTQTPTRDYAKATIEDTGVYDTGKPITTTGNHYKEHPAFPVTTVVPGSTEQHGALYLEEAEFATRCGVPAALGAGQMATATRAMAPINSRRWSTTTRSACRSTRRYHGSTRASSRRRNGTHSTWRPSTKSTPTTRRRRSCASTWTSTSWINCTKDL